VTGFGKHDWSGSRARCRTSSGKSSLTFELELQVTFFSAIGTLAELSVLLRLFQPLLASHLLTIPKLAVAFKPRRYSRPTLPNCKVSTLRRKRRQDGNKTTNLDQADHAQQEWYAKAFGVASRLYCHRFAIRSKHWHSLSCWWTISSILQRPAHRLLPRRILQNGSRRQGQSFHSSPSLQGISWFQCRQWQQSQRRWRQARNEVVLVRQQVEGSIRCSS